MGTSLTAHIDKMVRQREMDPEARTNRRETVRQRYDGVGGGRSALADSISRDMSAEASETADEEVAETRDALRRLRKSDTATRAEIAEARDEWQAARARRKELHDA